MFNSADRPQLSTSYNNELEIAQTDCFLICSVGFRIGAFIYIVACLVTVKVNDMAQVFVDLTGIGGINIASQNVRISSLHLVFLVLLLFFSLKSHEKL